MARGEASPVRILQTIAIAAALALPGAAGAVELGDAKAGHAYATSVCAECHEVGAGESFSPNPDAPSFQEVADTPGMTAQALSVWLQTSHPTMPDLIIEPDDMDNVVAYITSLRTPR
jgi:mono/diheme cytochrome c family protein